MWKELDLDLEDDDIEMKGMSEEHLTAKATVIYKRTVDKAASALKAKKDLESKKALKREKFIEDLVKRSPQEFLNQAIDQRIAAAKAKPQKKLTKNDVGLPPGLPVDAVSAFVSSGGTGLSEGFCHGARGYCCLTAKQGARQS